MRVQPIWQDTFIEFDVDKSPVNYSISTNDEIIFTGKAYASPNVKNTEFKTKINLICENYLSNDFNIFDNPPIENKTYTIEDATKKFIIRNEDTNEIIEELYFVYDWSFDKNQKYYDNVKTYMTKPINNRGKAGMYYFQSYFNGTNVLQFVSRTPINDYKEINDCNSKYAIYYLNAYGGWDSFLIEGYVTEKTEYSRKSIIRDNNNNLVDFETKPYMTDIQKFYEIHTGWLNQNESNILVNNLFQSTRVYLHNLETDLIEPLFLTDTNVTHKTYKNSGIKLLNYTINATVAQSQHNKN